MQTGPFFPISSPFTNQHPDNCGDPFENRLKAIVFDWGNTLMQVFPQYTGPMASWPQVAAVNGAKETLEKLQGHYPLFVATNASDSSPDQVKAALQQVGIAGYFNDIFTSASLGMARKPSPQFFSTLVKQIGSTPDSLMMVGDDFHQDILAAHCAGWLTAWYNPTRRPCPGMIPVQELEIHSLLDLSRALQRPVLPGWETCLHWMLGNGCPAGLMLHVQTVAALAYLLAAWLRAAGVQIDPLLTERAGLLHDIAKISALESDLDHGELGARYLEALGQPEIAQITRCHMVYCIIDPIRCPQSWEEKIVYFADKLVEGTNLTGIDAHLQSMQNRHPEYSQNIAEFTPAILALQDDISARLKLPSGQLLPEIKKALKRGDPFLPAREINF